MNDLILRKKVCSKCLIEKTELDFYPNTSKPGGLAGQCKDCSRADKREWYKDNSELQRSRVRDIDQRYKKNIDPSFGMTTCKGCNRSEPEIVFHLRKSGGRYYKRHLCTECFKKTKKRYPNNRSQESIRRADLSRRLKRSHRGSTAVHIVTDSRGVDKKKGRANDLDVDFVSKLIASHECSYCGENEIRMTLDRIDNAVGHIKTNVVPACIRCNSIRGDMPYAAWLLIADSVRQARVAGLFGDWQAKLMYKGNLEIVPLDEEHWMNIEAYKAV